jgi:hypothetical protein
VAGRESRPGQGADDRPEESGDDVPSFELAARDPLLEQFGSDPVECGQEDGDDGVGAERFVVFERGHQCGRESGVPE